MGERSGRFARALSARLKALGCAVRPRTAGLRDPQAAAAAPGDRRLEDAGFTQDETGRLAERRRLHRIAEWSSLRGRGL